MRSTHSDLLETPLCLYVVFHPDSDESRQIADSLHDWFRLKQDQGDGTEAGLPVWFRLHPDLDSSTGLQPEIAFNEAQLSVLVVLIDDRMVADETWRGSLEKLSAKAEERSSGSNRCLLLPVPVDSSAFRLSFLFAGRNRLFAGLSRSDDETQELGQASPAELEARSTRIRARSRMLRRGVTEALARELRHRTVTTRVHNPNPGAAPAPLEVFLSHAKGDGRQIARTIRDGLADFGQLKTWFDENDLPAGYEWVSPMIKAAEHNTAVLVSVVTDLYASRPWCRREVSLARTPRELALPGTPDKVSAWTVQPVVAVSQGNRTWHRPMAQLAQIPHLPWRARCGDDEGCLEDVVDRLLLEALLVQYYRCLAPRVAARAASRTNRRIALLTWVPDPWTLAQVRKELNTRSSEPAIIAYPGHGLRSVERGELEKFMRVIDLDSSNESTPKLIAQERLSELGLPKPIPTAIAVSGGGGNADVSTAGLGVGHVEDVLVRLTRRLLEHGHTLHYGGSLSNYESNFTKSMIDVAVGWDQIGGAGPAETQQPKETPFVNYAAWPYYRHIPTRQRAELQGICTFEEVDPPEGAPVAALAANLGSPSHAVGAANALSAMRAEVCSNTRLRIVVAGKLRGWNGWVPGILEEIALSCSPAAKEIGHCPLVFGGFGGASALVAGYLADTNAKWPEEMTYSFALEHNTRFRDVLMSQPVHRGPTSEYFDTLKDYVSDFRTRLQDADAEVKKVWKDALTCGSPSRAITLSVKAIGMVDAWA